MLKVALPQRMELLVLEALLRICPNMPTLERFLAPSICLITNLASVQLSLTRCLCLRIWTVVALLPSQRKANLISRMSISEIK